MDQVTQQNAALVEQSASAAEHLKSQAQRLVQAVAVFRLDREAVPAPAAPAAPVAAAAAWTGEERRGPQRATNVARPDFRSRRPAPARAALPGPGTGTYGG
jgi:hypothetical protein